MQTKDLIIYGAIIYLLYKITKQKECNCNTMVPIVPVNFAPVETKAIIPLLPLANCLNCNFKFKGKEAITVENSAINKIQDTVVTSLNMPDKCPHCKNPNPKKIRLCEWCGNQII